MSCLLRYSPSWGDGCLGGGGEGRSKTIRGIKESERGEERGKEGGKEGRRKEEGMKRKKRSEEYLIHTVKGQGNHQ